jgi:lipoic acid synthetase
LISGKVERVSAPSRPEWLKVRPPGGDAYAGLKSSLRELKLHTVCEEAHCPNVAECWGGGTATIMLLGDICTRACRFCAVKTGNPAGAVDEGEPARVAEAIARWGLNYVVLTMVNRDDLQDGGAQVVARTVEELHRLDPHLLVEVLVGDFQGSEEAVARVLAAGPDVFAHNIETVERLTPTVRDRRADFAQSLRVLKVARRMDPDLVTKSSIMLGLGEEDGEVAAAVGALREAGVDIVTFGQYLRPSPWHLQVESYVPPARFDAWKERAYQMGFRYCAAGPLVRSSYRAGEVFLDGLVRSRRTAGKARGA